MTTISHQERINVILEIVPKTTTRRAITAGCVPHQRICRSLDGHAEPRPSVEIGNFNKVIGFGCAEGQTIGSKCFPGSVPMGSWLVERDMW